VENDSQKRLMLALIASFALTAVYMLVGGGGSSGPKPAELPDAGVAAPVVSQVEHRAAPVQPTLAAPTTSLPARTLAVERPEVHYVLSTEGAGLASALLQGPKMREVRRLTIPEGFALLLGKEVPSAPQMNLA
jgi:YidC/Oxa1 family membrane protein insertase